MSTAVLSARDMFLDRLASELEVMGGAPPLSMQQYVEATNPTLLRYEHIPRLLDVGDRIISGELQNVMILEPPRYFKTEVFSRLLSGAYLTRWPRRLVGLASYGADLAWSISEEARDYYREFGGVLSGTTAAKKRWKNTDSGMMWAAGVGGPILGFGYHLGIVDDPTDPEKAHSYVYIRRFREWWPRKWISRGMPGAQKVLVMQRLSITDPIDFLLRREVGDDEDLAPEGWHVVLCDEIRSKEALGDWDGPMGLPPTCTLEPDPRPMGTVLAPSWMSEAAVHERQRSSGPVTTATQRQQRPTAPTGDFWKEHWFGVYDALPDDAYDAGWDWDLAYSREEVNSASAGVRSLRGPGKKDEFVIYIDNMDWDWLEFPKLVQFMRGKKGRHYIEAKASGKSARQTLSNEGIAAEEVSVPKDKLARASAVQPVVSNGRVLVRKSLLRRLLQTGRQGLLNVTAENLAANKGDLDLNDAFVQAITRHIGPQGKRRRIATTPTQIAKARAGTNGSK